MSHESVGVVTSAEDGRGQYVPPPPYPLLSPLMIARARPCSPPHAAGLYLQVLWAVCDCCVCRVCTHTPRALCRCRVDFPEQSNWMGDVEELVVEGAASEAALCPIAIGDRVRVKRGVIAPTYVACVCPTAIPPSPPPHAHLSAVYVTHVIVVGRHGWGYISRSSVGTVVDVTPPAR